MPHRPYGIPSPKPRPTYSGSTRAAWSGGAIIGGMILMVIVLGFIMYEVSKIGTHARNPATTAPPNAEVMHDDLGHLLRHAQMKGHHSENYRVTAKIDCCSDPQ
jgi:hypothetical protein